MSYLGPTIELESQILRGERSRGACCHGIGPVDFWNAAYFKNSNKMRHIWTWHSQSFDSGPTLGACTASLVHGAVSLKTPVEARNGLVRLKINLESLVRGLGMLWGSMGGVGTPGLGTNTLQGNRTRKVRKIWQKSLPRV